MSQLSEFVSGLEGFTASDAAQLLNAVAGSEGDFPKFMEIISKMGFDADQVSIAAMSYLKSFTAIHAPSEISTHVPVHDVPPVQDGWHTVTERNKTRRKERKATPPRGRSTKTAHFRRGAASPSGSDSGSGTGLKVQKPRVTRLVAGGDEMGGSIGRVFIPPSMTACNELLFNAHQTEFDGCKHEPVYLQVNDGVFTFRQKPGHKTTRHVYPHVTGGSLFYGLIRDGNTDDLYIVICTLFEGRVKTFLVPYFSGVTMGACIQQFHTNITIWQMNGTVGDITQFGVDHIILFHESGKLTNLYGDRIDQSHEKMVAAIVDYTDWFKEVYDKDHSLKASTEEDGMGCPAEE